VGYALQQSGWTRATQTGLGLSLLFALLVWWMRAGTLAAAFTGALLMAAMDCATVAQPDGSWWDSAIPPLLVLLTLTLLATRFRRRNKERSGLAESRKGRSAAQVCANLGMAALAALMAVGMHSPNARRMALLAMTAAFVEATADTLSSEIGQALPGRTILLTTGEMVPAGTDGGVSIAGTLAGLSGSLLVALVCRGTLHLSLYGMLAAWLAGLAGLFFDSLLGATLERRGWVGNNSVNFLSTAFAAGLAAVVAGLWTK